MKPWLIIAALLAILLAGFQGYRMGSAANEARHVAVMAAAQAKALAEGRAQALAEAARLADAEVARLLSQQLEDQAYAAPIQSHECLPVSRVLRINRR